MNYILRGSLTAFLLLNIGCLDGGIDCGPFTAQYIDVIGLNGSNVALGNSYSDFANLAEGVTIAYTSFGIRAVPEIIYEGRAASLTGGFLAYACSPPPPQPTEAIAEIAIFSSAAYVQATSSKVFAAGDTLNSIVKIYEPYSGRIVGLPDFLLGEDLMASDEAFTLQLAVAPMNATEHQFTVHYRLENGEFYQFNTDTVIITP